MKDPVEQRSPTFLAPGTSGFVEDNSSSDGGGRGRGGGDGSGSKASDGERRGTVDETSITRLPLTFC